MEINQVQSRTQYLALWPNIAHHPEVSVSVGENNTISNEVLFHLCILLDKHFVGELK